MFVMDPSGDSPGYGAVAGSLSIGPVALYVGN